MGHCRWVIEKFLAAIDFPTTAPTVGLQVSSDDGTRLYVDGELILDNWRNQRLRTKGKTLDLEAGTHQLRLEYYEKTGAAAVNLSASFDGEQPAPIPFQLLTYPGDEIDDSDPCAG